jgi:hypothetical protein
MIQRAAYVGTAALGCPSSAARQLFADGRLHLRPFVASFGADRDVASDLVYDEAPLRGWTAEAAVPT